MQNFEFYPRTKIIFGKDTESKTGAETAQYAKKILLHHSGGHAEVTHGVRHQNF